MLKVVYSNDMLQLAARLAEQQKAMPLPPLEAETIIVQSNELARWLSLYLAQSHGVASHIDFPYPSAYIWSLFRTVFPDVPKESAFGKDALTWRIFDLLAACKEQKAFAAVAHYLGDNDDMAKRFGLAHRIADSFDQYLMYRSDWLQSWEQADAELPHWQAILWRRLTEQESQPVLHRANLLLRLKQHLTQATEPPPGLPRRLSIFGLSALPPMYLELYELMAKFCDITLYFLSPCEAYWGDLLSPKQAGQQALDLGDNAVNSDLGHPLLSSLGKQGQDFFEQLQQTEHASESVFTPPETDTLLGQLQSDIVQLIDPEKEIGRRSISAEDDSIQCHACHSATREVEVLHDQLLALFERHPELSPTDVVVMTPDIDIYADAIDAVFGTAESDLFIPYSISGATSSEQSPVLSAFNSLLSLPESRFEVDSVVALLECEAVQHRFALQEDDVALIRRWCRETQIRWGLSGNDKATLGLPVTEANSWQAGLDRLLLGYALPLSDDQGQWRLFKGRLGIDGIRGERAQTVAKLCAFIDSLKTARQQLTQASTVQQWQQRLLSLLQQFFKPHFDQQRDQADILSLTNVFDSLVTSAELATFEQAVSLNVVREYVKGHIESSPSDHHFMGHGVTFCGMVPMRSIPFAVVCLIGMNDSSFPRRQPQLGFDLLAHDFRRGDRSRRDDDRYLFLEAILSAQQHLYMSYVGRSIIDNAPIPPSVLVSDVADVLRHSFQGEQGQDIWQQLLTEHPLQAFSRRYFDGESEKLVSYQAMYCPPEHHASAQPAWADLLLPEPDESGRQITLFQLMQFYRHPTRYLLQQRLGLYFEDEEAALENREPFSLTGLAAWQCQQYILTHRLQEKTTNDIQQTLTATGLLPQGHIGEQVLSQQIAFVDAFVDTLLLDYPTQFLTPLPFDLALGDFTLSGQLDNVSEQGLFLYQLSNMKARGLIAIWCQHLVLNCLQPQGVTCQTRWICKDKVIHFSQVDAPESELETLLQLYWMGCQTPLRFFPETSFRYAQTELKAGKADPDKAAKAAWLGSEYSSAESDDLYYQRVYPSFDFDDASRELALTIYAPLLAHMTEQKR